MIVIIGLGFLMAVWIGIFIYILLNDQESKVKQDLKSYSENILSVANEEKLTKNVGSDFFVKGLDMIQIQNQDFQKIKTEIQKHIIWMNDLIVSMFIGILCQWHLLIQWAPWLAKTKTVNIFAQLFWLKFKRIQFTPDMLPSDVIWSEIYNQKTQEFDIQLWPIVANIVLADEINRTTPKVQSALLEAMQEKQITIAWKTYKLPEPFLVLATQNPIEQEWTYPLPEAQLDRFMMKVLVDYPDLDDEKQILDVLEHEELKITKLMTHKQLQNLQKEVWNVEISDVVKNYIASLVTNTRKPNKYIKYWASPRASINLMFASKAVAFLEGRNVVEIKDVQRVYLPIMRHRIILNYEALANNISADQVLLDIL